jgi:hypothetical protein
MMDIEQVRQARREMEDTIQAAVLEAIRVFHEKTDMCPQSIDVPLVNVTTMGERGLRFAVGEVRADVPL